MSSSRILHKNLSTLLILISLLLLSSLLPKSIGIRWDDSFKQVASQKFQEKNGSYMERSFKISEKNVILCKEGHCKGTISRKLDALTSSTSASTTTTSTKPGSTNGGTQAKFPISDVEYSHDDHYFVDLVDIAEMDYSPARRKPPIHN